MFDRKIRRQSSRLKLKLTIKQFIFRAERDDISGVSERRQEEIERLHTKVKDLTEERDQAVSLRCEAQARLEDLQSKEINIEFREKRLAEERTFLESQIQMLKVGPLHVDSSLFHPRGCFPI